MAFHYSRIYPAKPGKLFTTMQQTFANIDTKSPHETWNLYKQQYDWLKLRFL